MTTFAYDKDGNQIQTVLPGNQISTSTFDVANRLVSSTDAAGNETTYGYDGDGDVTMTDTGGIITTSGFDLAGRTLWTGDAKGIADFV